MKASSLGPLSSINLLIWLFERHETRLNLGVKTNHKKTNIKIQNSNLIMHWSNENESIQLQLKKKIGWLQGY